MPAAPGALVSFAPVVVEAAAPAPIVRRRRARRVVPGSAPMIEVAVAGAVIRVPRGADADTLGAVVRALKAAP